MWLGVPGSHGSRGTTLLQVRPEQSWTQRPAAASNVTQHGPTNQRQGCKGATKKTNPTGPETGESSPTQAFCRHVRLDTAPQKAGNGYPRKEHLWLRAKRPGMKWGPASHTDAAGLQACVYRNSGHLASISQVKVLFSLALASLLSIESNS